jgi:lipopolysaccharide/colanic/teichoic acid biosynthesis glycosyltransferase
VIVKRLLDVLVAAVSLAVLSPVLLVVAVLVRLDSTGPVIFKQERVGRKGIPFEIHKFRTMTMQLGPARVGGAVAQRVTRVGALLRRMKLDELPQLVDVLIGNMSLVGPRPELARYVALWPDEDRARILSVRPGITDPASIVFRDEASILAAAPDAEQHYVEQILPRKVAMYVDYVENRSLRGDIRVLWQTIRAVIRT